MLTASQINRLTDRADWAAKETHDIIIECIVKHLVKRLSDADEITLTATDAYHLKTIQQAGYLLADVRRELQKRTGITRQEMQLAFEQAGVEVQRKSDIIYRAAGIEVPTRMSAAILRIWQAGYMATAGSYQNLTQTTANACYTAFVSACDEAYSAVEMGALTFGQAYTKAIMDISQDGVIVTYPSGHADTIETAVARAVRTGIVQTTAQVVAQRAVENGVTCFLTTSHATARPSHAVWQGKVFWVDWQELVKRISIDAGGELPQASDEEKAKYKEFCQATDIGSITGLCGINCRHAYMPFFDGLLTNNQIDYGNTDEAYAIEQKQRMLENRIRHTKRDIESAKEALNGTTDAQAIQSLEKIIDRKKGVLKRQQAEYKAWNEQNGLRAYPDRLKIAKTA